MSMGLATGLGLLALSAFTSATILPGSSEAALAVFMEQFANDIALGFVVVTIANTLGSVTSLWLGRMIPQKKKLGERTQKIINRFGSASMLLAWVPVLGDAFPVAAGWLRLSFWPCVVYLLIGKALRYGVIVWLWQNGGSHLFNTILG